MKKRNTLAAILACCCFLAVGIAPAQAEPAVYRNGQLEISEGILVQPGGDSYYRDIELRTQPDGSMKIVRAQKRNLATLEELELNVVYSDEVEVELYVAGYLPVDCLDLEPVAVSRRGDTFHVLIARTPLDPLALCAQVIEPFDMTLTLDANHLEPGDYVVLVNNEPMEFTIEDVSL